MGFTAESMQPKNELTYTQAMVMKWTRCVFDCVHFIWIQTFDMMLHFTISGKSPDPPGACWSGWTGKNAFSVQSTK